MSTIGIDVSRSSLDISLPERSVTIANQEDAITRFFSNICQSSKIILEATGKYHRKAHALLSELGFSVMVINPYQSRYFARAMHVLCKTDKVDAKLLRLYGDKMPFTETKPLTGSAVELQALSRHLDDLHKIKQDLASRRRESEGFIAASLANTIASLSQEINLTEQALQVSIKQDVELKRKATLLESIPGVGPATAIMLLSYLRELGTVSKREISALAGLAPINNDSGTMTGKRSIQRGRRDVRTNLYMPIVGAATQHNPRLNMLYKKLILKGKPAKVALTACMRKLVVWANAIIETDKPWDENAN